MNIRVGLCVLLGSLLTANSEAGETSAWQHELSAMLWASGLEGRQSVGPLEANVDASFSDLIDFVDGGGAVRFTAQRERIGWFLEASYVELEKSTTGRLGPARAELGQTIAEGGMSYELVDRFALYGGARFQSLDLEITHAVLRSVRTKTDWIDAIVGAQWTPIDHGAWRAWARADIGSGGADFQWLAEAGAALRFATAWNVSAAYRILDVDYESGRFRYDMQQSGFILAVGVRF